MSTIARYVDLELQKAELFERIAKAGSVTEMDQITAKAIVLSLSDNAHILFDELQNRTVSRFDAETLFRNSHLRYELCLGYVHVEPYAGQGVELEHIKWFMTHEVVTHEAKTMRNAGLIQLARDKNFMDGLGNSDAMIAQRLKAYADDKKSRPLPEHDDSNAERDYEDRAKLYSAAIEGFLKSYLGKPWKPAQLEA